MRVLLLLRGAPGCGKSTWIQENGLKDYALCADDIRMMCASPSLDIHGKPCIDQKNDKVVWDILMELLKVRMEHGEFTVIDATNSKTADMNKYKALCKDYRYRMYCVDFTNIPIEEVKRRNSERTPLKIVPEAAIDKMYARFATQKIPAGITVLEPDELDKVWYRPLDLNEYEKINVIGDIHGCYSVLKKYLKEGFKDNEYYIFLGDYLDRGLENADVLQFLIDSYKRKNVYFIEGNHERHLWKWSHNETSRSKEFEFVTKPQLEKHNFDLREVRQLYRSFGQCAFFEFAGKTYLCNHGGISSLTDNLIMVSTYQLIHGVGTYADHDVTDKSFSDAYAPDVIQIHGHRNTKNLSIDEIPGTFNLEGGVERGGCLRCVELTKDGEYITVEVENEVYKVPEVQNEAEHKNVETVEEMIMQFRQNKYVNEKNFGDIASFNFTKSAFYNKVWDAQTVKARGMFVNIPKRKIVARSYDKFFNIGEREDTKIDSLKDKLVFPVHAYVKENGYLGILGYNEDDDDLFFASKSSPESEYAEWFRKIFYDTVSLESTLKIKSYLKSTVTSMVFEVKDSVRDPHIIKYNTPELTLLDIIPNEVTFNPYNYSEVSAAAMAFGLHCKKRAATLHNWVEFIDFYNKATGEDYKFDGRRIEGFVFVDANGYMVKLKTYYYNFWKHLRGISDEVLQKGYTERTSSLTNAEANYFYGFLKEYREREIEKQRLLHQELMHNTGFFAKLFKRHEEPFKPHRIYADIISLRDKFYETENGKAFKAV